jgi:hypothetical protein
MSDSIAYEKLVPVVSLIAAGIAVSFDVGYFYGVGIDYFTLFSLSEHILFALEALPVALPLALSAALGVVVSGLITSRAETTLDTKRSAEQKLAYLKKLRLIFIIVVCAINGLLFFVFWYFGWFRTCVVAAIIPLLLLAPLASDHWRSVMLLGLFVIGVCAAILLGEFLDRGMFSFCQRKTCLFCLGKKARPKDRLL